MAIGLVIAMGQTAGVAKAGGRSRGDLAVRQGVILVQSGQAPTSRSDTASPARTEGKDRLVRAKSWGYQLRGIDPAVIAQSLYDIVVIDFADRERPFTAAEVEAMRAKPDGGRRVVLAYLSVGEAERYRYYWQADWYARQPAWLGPENPEWKGNFPVRYWDADWQKLMFGGPGSYLDRIIEAGFDGAYLDRVDVYSNWEKEKSDAEQRMVEFVVALSAYAKKQQSGFLIVPQNGEELLENEDYLQAIDGAAKEDLLYGVDHGGTANPADMVEHSLGLLRQARGAGKTILVVEYLCGRDEIAAVERRISDGLGFLPFVGPRTLHSLGMEQSDYCLPSGPGGRRIALLLASGAYKNGPRLVAPAHDVGLLASALRTAGFTDVRERIDLGRDAISQELQRFAESARDADWAIVYYAGLGLRLEDTNYLVPVNADITRSSDVDRESIAMDEIETSVAPAKHVRIIFLDACRPNVFLQRLQQRGLTEAAGPGVAAKPPQQPVLIVYSSPCEAPLPEPTSDTDAFTVALARHLLTPGLELPWLLERVKDSVLRATKGGQQPVYFGTLPDAASFVGSKDAPASK